MPESNTEKVRAATGDLQALIDLLDEEIVWDNTRYSPIDQGGVFRGKAAVEKIITEWVGAWAGFKFEVEEISESGNHVIAAVTESGIGKSSGAPMEHRYVQVWSFRDGKIVGGSAFPTRAEALAAVADWAP